MPTVRLPLLRDHHTHPLLYAAFAEGVDLGRDAREAPADALARLRARAAGAEGWTLGYGWPSHRPLAAADLDGLPPVVVFDRSLHGLTVNAAGRAALRQTDPEAADHLDDPAWIEHHLRRVHNLFLGSVSPTQLQRFYDHLLHDHGIWFAEEMLLAGADEIRLFDAAGLAHRTRFWAAPETYDALPPDHRARVHGVKLFTDGAIGTHTAALSQPYRDAPTAGVLTYTDAALHAVLARYVPAGVPVAVHAIGDRAIRQVVDAVEAVGGPAGGEVRIEHAQLIDRATARRAKALGIALCMQPNFSDDSRHYAGRLPSGFAEANNPFRMLIDDVGFAPGADLLFGSDGMPHGAAEALRQALFPPLDAQRLTLAEILAGYGMPDAGGGVIEADIDADAQRVACRVVVATP